MHDLQDSLTDSCDAVVALTLDSIGALCNRDALEFYQSWQVPRMRLVSGSVLLPITINDGLPQVVHRVLPRLPRGPLASVAWLDLLSHGALDAEVFPDRARALMQLLWAATCHAVAEVPLSQTAAPTCVSSGPLETDTVRMKQVRGAAYRALKAFSIPVLAACEALRPLRCYLDLLLAEWDGVALSSASELLAVILQDEASNASRCGCSCLGTTALTSARLPMVGSGRCSPRHQRAASHASTQLYSAPLCC